MNIHELVQELREPAATKIVFLVADGLGGLPIEKGGRTELETANTPNFDALVKDGVCGLSTPVLPGIAPGSGPGHLALFGYDPLQYRIGRGILEALGINFAVGPKDVAIRGNFCTLGPDGKITDRRAGRPSNEKNAAAVARLRTIQIPGVELFVEPVREHRFVLVIRGDELGDAVNDTDPQQVGLEPLVAGPVRQQTVAATAEEPGDRASERTAAVVNEFVAKARQALRDEGPINGATLRGFAKMPRIATFEQVYGLKAAAIAVYPMYKGLARLVGMDILDPGQTLQGQIDTLKSVWDKYDFFFLHYKYTDSTGEDGNFAAKVEKIEALDAEVPKLRALAPDVLLVTGDHSTPSRMRSHSFHPVPVLLWAPATGRPDRVTEFGERTCIHGGLGHILAKDLMPLALAHAGRLQKFGA